MDSWPSLRPGSSPFHQPQLTPRLDRAVGRNSRLVRLPTTVLSGQLASDPSSHDQQKAMNDNRLQGTEPFKSKGTRELAELSMLPCHGKVLDSVRSTVRVDAVQYPPRSLSSANECPFGPSVDLTSLSSGAWWMLQLAVPCSCLKPQVLLAHTLSSHTTSKKPVDY